MASCTEHFKVSFKECVRIYHTQSDKRNRSQPEKTALACCKLCECGWQMLRGSHWTGSHIAHTARKLVEWQGIGQSSVAGFQPAQSNLPPKEEVLHRGRSLQTQISGAMQEHSLIRKKRGHKLNMPGSRIQYETSRTESRIVDIVFWLLPRKKVLQRGEPPCAKRWPTAKDPPSAEGRASGKQRCAMGRDG